MCDIKTDDAEKLKYERERTESACKQEIQMVVMAMEARTFLGLGYHGHGIENYRWQASGLVPHLEKAIQLAKTLSVDGL